MGDTQEWNETWGVKRKQVFWNERTRRKALTVDEKFCPRQNGGRLIATANPLALFTTSGPAGYREQGLNVEVPGSGVQYGAEFGLLCAHDHFITRLTRRITSQLPYAGTQIAVSGYSR